MIDVGVVELNWIMQGRIGSTEEFWNEVVLASVHSRYYSLPTHPYSHHSRVKYT